MNPVLSPRGVCVFARVCLSVLKRVVTAAQSEHLVCLLVGFLFLLQAGDQMGIPLTQQASNESRLSMSESVSEFFDAQEVLLSASSSENEV